MSISGLHSWKRLSNAEKVIGVTAVIVLMKIDHPFVFCLTKISVENVCLSDRVPDGNKGQFCTPHSCK